MTVQVKAAGVQDLALNNNTASNTISVHVDTRVPTVAISGEPTIKKNVPFDLTVTFSEAVNWLCGACGSGAYRTRYSEFEVRGIDGDKDYVVTITPAANSEGPVTVQVKAAGVQDFALNDNTASAVSTTVHVDTIVPTVAISGEPSGEARGTFTLTVTFSEPVTGFAVPADLMLTGPATASLEEGVDGDLVYRVTITPTAEGTVTITVLASAAVDTAGNGNTVASVTVYVDPIPPTVAISGEPTIREECSF